MSPTDAELVARVLAGDDRHAFGQLVRRCQSPVRALLRRLTCGDHALADDLAQETFVRAYRGLHRYRGGSQLSSWLYRIAYNVFLTERARRRLELVETPTLEAAADGDALARLDVTRAMAVLSDPERASLALAYVAGATHEEIAEVLDCPLGTAKTHIARAKEKLRERLQGWSPREAS